MIKLYQKGVYLINNSVIVAEEDLENLKKQGISNIDINSLNKEEAIKGTISYGILKEHNKSKDMENLKLSFDALASHDITYVGIIQTAKASGMKEFPLPYVLTNCHNSLCAVGGTINADDHLFGLSAAKKYSGIYVPPHIAVIHQYMREAMAGCGKMILGSDSHTRYGALGTMAIGEGGGELVKQLLEDTYDLKRPEVVGVYLKGKAQPFVGPQDIALAIIKAVFKNGYVKNKIMEFLGDGIAGMSTDYRNGIDVMTTETTCLSSIWMTDEDTKEFLKEHKRESDYKKLEPKNVAYYDGFIEVDLDKIVSMIALPFHPSNVYSINELNNNLVDILHTVEEESEKIAGKEARLSLVDKIENGKLRVSQGIIAGCAGGNYTNVLEAANIVKNKSIGNGEFTLSVYPSSQAVYIDAVRKGAITELMAAGAIVKTAFCGPCFGAGDTSHHNGLSIRHTTRNFPNRDGSKPTENQMSGVALMDARSIATTAINGGFLTPANEFYEEYEVPKYSYDSKVYDNRVYNGFGVKTSEELIYGPNIKDWPSMESLADNILLKVVTKIEDEVTTTDELIPSGETSSYRSNPLRLAEFTLSRRDPMYVQRAKEVDRVERARRAGDNIFNLDNHLKFVFDKIKNINGFDNISEKETMLASVLYANKPGDGSAREQAASCQRVLGGLANIVKEYATKRYRSNVINWGMLPFVLDEENIDFEVGSYIFIPNIRKKVDTDMSEIEAYVIDDVVKKIKLHIDYMTDEEKEIVKAGSLINYNRIRKFGE